MKKYFIGTSAILMIVGGGIVNPLSAQPQPPAGGPPPSGQQRPPSGGQQPPSGQQRPPSGGQQPPSGQFQISEAMLRDYVTDQNKELPEVIDNTIRWDSIALGTGRTLIYSYTFLSPSIQAISPQETTQIKNSILETVCQDQQIAILLNDAVSFNFKYNSSGGKFLTEVFINRSDCRR